MQESRGANTRRQECLVNTRVSWVVGLSLLQSFGRFHVTDGRGPVLGGGPGEMALPDDHGNGGKGGADMPGEP